MELILFIVFAIIVGGFLIFDLGYLNRKAHAIGIREAALQSLFWVAISIFFGSLVFLSVGHELAAQFFSAYVTEKMLSVDNLFVMMLIFRKFQVQEKYYHRVLLWGILGAVVFRALFITTGVAVIALFHWVLYLFGAILIYTGAKLFLGNDDDEDVKENRAFRAITARMKFVTDQSGTFVKTINGKRYFTTLLMVLLLIETTDIIFAFDSIPAVLAISQDWFIVFTSNIFAVMGLRALFFLVEDILSRFRYMGKGVALILIFIGLKMFSELVHIHISSLTSLTIIVLTLTGALCLSGLFPKGGE